MNNSVDCAYAGAAVLPSSFFPNDLFKSDYQNGCEFTALNCGIVHMLTFGFHDCSIVIRGDSNTVCHWTESDHFRSDIAVAPILFFLTLCTTFHIHVVIGEHIPKEENTICDDLSRQEYTSDRVLQGCGPEGVSFPTSNGLIENAISCCSLGQSAVSEHDFFRFVAISEALLW